MTDPQSFKDFLFGYYNRLPIDPNIQALMKSDVPLTYSTSTSWFDPVYLGRLMLEGLTRSTKCFRALTKTTYQSEGDSYQVIDTDAAAGLSNILEAEEDLFDPTSVPALVPIDYIYPAILKVTWSNTEVAAAMSQIQRSRATPNLEQIRDYMSRIFLDRLDMQLCGVYNDFLETGAGEDPGYGVDSPAVTETPSAEIEGIDRMITDDVECTGTTYVSAAADGDIFWSATGTGARFERDASEACATVRMNTTAGTEEAYNICDELDDLMAQALVYAEEPYNYIAMMSPKAYNKIKAENDPKALIIDYTDARQTVGGISSTPGVVGGKVQLSALRLSDITVPIVTIPYLMGTEDSDWLWKNSKHAGGVGHIYLINQDAMEFRTLIPITYRSVPAENALTTKNILYMAGQLIAKNWKSHAALKNIAV